MNDDELLADFFTPKTEPNADDILKDFFTPKAPILSEADREMGRRLEGLGSRPEMFLPQQAQGTPRDKELRGLQTLLDMTADPKEQQRIIEQMKPLITQPLSREEGDKKLEQYRQSFIRQGTNNADYIAERLPVVGLLRTGLQANERIQASKRIEAGKATEEDFKTIGKMLAESSIAENRTQGLDRTERVGVKALDLATSLPAILTEWAMSGPTGAIGRGAAQQAAKRVMGGLAERSAVRFATGAVGEGVGRTLSGIGLAQVGAGAADRMSHGDSMAKAIKDTAVAKLIENTVFSGVGRPGTVPGIAAAEVNMEGQYQAGVSPQGSNISRMLNGDPHAAEDLAAMVIVFGGLHGIQNATKAAQAKIADMRMKGYDPASEVVYKEVQKIIEEKAKPIEDIPKPEYIPRDEASPPAAQEQPRGGGGHVNLKSTPFNRGKVMATAQEMAERNPAMIVTVDGTRIEPRQKPRMAEVSAEAPKWPKQQVADGEPPIPDGFVRMYHGGTDQNGPRWASPERSYAEGYRDKMTTGKDLYYVDLPADSPLLKKAADDTGTNMVAPAMNIELPPEVARTMKKLGGTAEPAADTPIAQQYDGLRKFAEGMIAGKSLHDIAREVGAPIGDYGKNIRKLLKDEFGMTPKEFVEEHRKWLEEQKKEQSGPDAGSLFMLSDKELSVLTPKQRRLYELMTGGYQDADIAKMTGTKRQNIGDMRRNIAKKLQLDLDALEADRIEAQINERRSRAESAQQRGVAEGAKVNRAMEDAGEKIGRAGVAKDEVRQLQDQVTLLSNKWLKSQDDATLGELVKLSERLDKLERAENERTGRTGSERMAKDATGSRRVPETAAADQGVSGSGRSPQERTLFDEFLYQKRSGKRTIQGTSGVEPSTTGPYNIQAMVDVLFGKAYVKTLPRQDAQAMYQQHIDHLSLNGMNAGNVPVRMHEEAHRLIEKDASKPLDPTKLTKDVIAGYREFDYMPRRGSVPIAMKEGFSEFVRKYVDNDLGTLTPNQQAAANHAMAYLKSNGTLEKLDRVKAEFDKFKNAPVADQMSGMISATGKPAPPVGLAIGERAGEYLKELNDKAVDTWIDRLNPLVTMEKSSGKTPSPGEDIRTIASQMHFAAEPNSDRAAKEGIFTWRKDANGELREVTISGPITDMVKDLPAELLKPAGYFSDFVIARSIISNAERGARMAQSVNPDIQEKGVNKLMMVDDWQIDVAKRFMEEAKKHPYYKQLEEAAYKYTELQRALKEVQRDTGIFTDQDIQNMFANDPDYVPMFRVMGDKPAEASLRFNRAGSGRQIVDPIISMRNLYDLTYSLAGRQMIDKAMHQLGKQSSGPEGVPGYWKRVEQDRTPLSATKKAEVEDALAALGYDVITIGNIINNMGADALSYAGKHKPWSKSGDNFYSMRIDGEPVRIEVFNERLYNYLTGEQSSELKTFTEMKVAKAIASTVRLQKAGATSYRIAFSPLNMIRDIPRYMSKGIADGMGPVELVRDYFRSAPEVLYNHMTKILGMKPTAFYKMYEDMAGGEKIRAYGGLVERGEGAMAWREVQGKDSGAKKYAIHAANKVLDVINLWGSPEHFGRFAAMKQYLEKVGYTRKQIEASLKANPNVSPIPLDVWLATGQHLRNRTTDFSKGGSAVTEINKVAPFFGAHMTGMEQDARLFVKGMNDMRKGNFTSKYAIAATGSLATLMVLEGLHHALYRDEKWYDDQPAHIRHRWFILGQDSNGALWGVPKPHGVLMNLGAMFQEAFRGDKGRWDLAGKTVLKETLANPLPTGLKESFDVATNKTWSGQPIVPNEGRYMSEWDKTMNHYLPYVLEQLSGGLTEPGNQRLPHQAFRATRNVPSQPVEDLYAKYHNESVTRQNHPERTAGGKYPNEKNYKILEDATQEIAKINNELAGKKKKGNRLIDGEKPSEERAVELRKKKVEIAKKALEKYGK